VPELSSSYLVRVRVRVSARDRARARVRVRVRSSYFAKRSIAKRRSLSCAVNV